MVILDVRFQQTIAGGRNSFAGRIFVCSSTGIARSVKPCALPAAKQSVTKTRFHCNPGLQISPGPTVNLDGQLRRKVAGVRRPIAGVRRNRMKPGGKS
jgi:hypothetical protein